VREALAAIRAPIALCPIGRLEQLYSARSAADYDQVADALGAAFPFVDPPATIFEDVLALQRDLARHHGMWHRTALPDLFIAVTALSHRYGVLHVDRDYDRIAEIRPLVARRVG
jgi:predicted nucleic acid-binding protein